MAVFAGYSFLRTCSSRKYTYPPPPRRAAEIQRGGGVQKEAISEVVGGGFLRFFFLGAPIKIGELLKRNTVLLSELTVILLIICVAKQKLLFSWMIFYLQLTECFFHGLHDSLCNTIVAAHK